MSKNPQNCQKISELLPNDPDLKARVIKSIMDSPRKQTHRILERDGTINTKENQEKAVIYDCIIGDSSEVIDQIKSKRSNAILNIRQKLAAICIGKRAKANKKTRKLAQKFHVVKRERRVRKWKLGEALFVGDDAAYADVIRKSRGQIIPDDWKIQISDYWTNEASHPTSDSTRNRVRRRISTKDYISHDRHIMTKTYQHKHFQISTKPIQIFQ